MAWESSIAKASNETTPDHIKLRIVTDFPYSPIVKSSSKATVSDDFFQCSVPVIPEKPIKFNAGGARHAIVDGILLHLVHGPLERAELRVRHNLFLRAEYPLDSSKYPFGSYVKTVSCF